MPVVNVNLLVDEKTYLGIKSGVLELCGMAKNVDNKRIAKHIPVVADAAKDGAAKAIDFIRLHKKGTLIVGGIIIAGGAVAGTISYFIARDKRKRNKKFAENLQIYLDAAREGILTIDIINTLINSLDQIQKDDKSKEVILPITATQFKNLIQSIFDYTIRLAEANNVDTDTIIKPKNMRNKSYLDLQYYLNIQKNIFEQAA